jgi:Rieske Fe-S protein
MNSRRDFLKKTLGATIVAAAAPIVCACGETVYAKEAPMASSGTLTIDLSKALTTTQYNNLKVAEGSIAYVPPTGNPNHGLTFIITRKDDLSLIVFSNVCPHQGAKQIQPFNKTTQRHKCNQHGSLFDIDGVVKLGPAASNLKKYTVDYDGVDLLKITGTGIVDSNLDTPPVESQPFSLEQNYPDPFIDKTTIRFSLGSDEQVSLMITDGLGKAITVLHDGFLAAGEHAREFDGTSIAPGMYFYRLTTPSGTLIKQMVKN